MKNSQATCFFKAQIHYENLGRNWKSLPSSAHRYFPLKIHSRLRQKRVDVFNYHLTNACNYGCKYCFGKFPCSALSLEAAELVVENVKRYFVENSIGRGRINLVGGEPLLYPKIDDLISFINELGIDASIVTNGSLLTEDLVASWRGKVSCIGLSIDSVKERSNLAIGRASRGKTLSLAELKTIAGWVRGAGIKLKVNTVVSRLNLSEDLLEVYRALKPERLKLFQVQVVEGTNDSAKRFLISRDEFEGFRKKVASEFPNLVGEHEGQMENSYVMIDPAGRILMNNEGRYEVYGSCLEREVGKILEATPLDKEKFNARYF